MVVKTSIAISQGEKGTKVPAAKMKRTAARQPRRNFTDEIATVSGLAGGVSDLGAASKGFIDPAEVIRVALKDGERDHFRDRVRMDGLYFLDKFRNAGLFGFDDEERLGSLFDPAFPPVTRGYFGDHVDAGGEFRLQQSHGNFVRFLGRRRGDEDHAVRTHSPASIAKGQKLRKLLKCYKNVTKM